MILSRDFYCADPIAVARSLVGAYLCRRMPDGNIIRARVRKQAHKYVCLSFLIYYNRALANNLYFIIV